VTDWDAVAADLRPRLPSSAWEGWFVIAIGARGTAVRWAKTHVFRSVRMPGRHPIAALEGLRATPGEIVSWIATADAVEVERATLDGAAAAGCARDPFTLALPGALSLAPGTAPGTWRFVRDTLEAPGAGAGAAAAIDLTLAGRDQVEWLRLPRVLTYSGVHCAARGTVRAAGTSHDFAGLGVLEHAWGGTLPFDPQRLVRGPWHWDVLHLNDDAEKPGAGAAVAALWLTIPLLGVRGVRAAGRLPGTPFRPLQPVSLEPLARDANGVPRSWVGRLRDAHAGADIIYEARASTPVAAAAPGVFFQGFDFELTRAGRRHAGSGFCECGGPPRAL
jgi:hypothetical protein